MTKVTEVKSQLATHEEVCAERWKETILRITRIESILIGVAGTMILIIATIMYKK